MWPNSGFGIDSITGNGGQEGSPLVFNGSGSVAQKLVSSGMDPGVLRPWLDRNGRSYVTKQTGRYIQNKDSGLLEAEYKNYLLTNTQALLPKEAWLQMDETIMEAVRTPIRVVSDLRSAGLTYNLPNALGKTFLQHQRMTDAGSARLSMDMKIKSDRDRPTYDLQGIPLPVVHGEFSIDLRELEVSRQTNAPLDTTMISNITDKCQRIIEGLTLGTLDTYSFAGGTVYGLRNQPDRMLKTLTLPTAGGWTPATLFTQFLEMMQQLRDKQYFGPFGVYYSPAWDQYLERDYAAAYLGTNLRTKILAIKGIKWFELAEQLPDYEMVMFELKPRTIQLVEGLPLQPIQWEEQGGLELHIKIFGMTVPRMRSQQKASDLSEQIGIVHATAA